MHIAIIGAGIIGAALAHRLTTASAQVTLIDAANPGQATSGSSLGWINANKTHNAAYWEFRVAAMRAWTRLAEEFTDSTWYRPTGNLMWAETRQQRDGLARRVSWLNEHGYRANLVDADQVTDIEPALVMPPGALAAHFPDEGYALGGLAAQALSDRAEQVGARLVTGNAAIGLELDHGTPTVKLASGQPIHADTIVCAAGWRAPELLATAHVTIPLQDAHQAGSTAPCLVATTTGPVALRSIVHTPDLYARPTGDAALILEASSTDTMVDMQTTNTELTRHATELLARARAIAPALAEAQIKRSQRCIRPMPVDGFPLIGWTRAGLYTAVTHSGITLAPYLAELITHELLDEIPSSTLTPYRPTRKS